MEVFKVTDPSFNGNLRVSRCNKNDPRRGDFYFESSGEPALSLIEIEKMFAAIKEAATQPIPEE